MKRSPDHPLPHLAALCAGLLGSSASQAQEDRAAPRRYLNTVFPDYVRHGDILFAENLNNLDGKVEKLTLRVFEPKGDTVAKRPAGGADARRRLRANRRHVDGRLRRRVGPRRLCGGHQPLPAVTRYQQP